MPHMPRGAQTILQLMLETKLQGTYYYLLLSDNTK